MSNLDRITGVVYRTIDAVNDLLPVEQALEVSGDLVLVGQDASLDSMGFVNFMVALEEELERELERDLNIADLLNMQTNAGGSVSTAADLIRVLSERFG